MSLVEIGRIVRLQAQARSLKVGEGRAKRYDPAGIVPVDSFALTRDGVSFETEDGERLDVHHALHPLTKNRARSNGVSVGFTSHYARMRERFAERLSDGIAGENILVETQRSFSLDDVEGGLLARTADGRCVALGDVSVAHPCVEFSRYALGDPQADPKVVSDTLKFLDGGTRGFYALAETDAPFRLSVGDSVLLTLPGGD